MNASSDYLNMVKCFILPLKNIHRKGVLVETDSCKCVVVQPNVYERH